MATLSSIKRAYNNKRLKGAFTGLPAFIQANNYKSPKKVRKALQELKSYTLHKRVLHKFPRRVTRVFFPDYQWGADLMDVSNVSKYNRNVKYILLIICNFSKYIWTYPLVSKGAADVEKGLATILKRAKAAPNFLLVDEGKVWSFLLYIYIRNPLTREKMLYCMYLLPEILTNMHLYRNFTTNVSRPYVKRTISK